MKKTDLDYWIDIGLVITFFLTFITGIFKWPSLYKFFRGFDFKLITFIHDWSGLIMGLLVLMHIITHFKWIKVMTKKIFMRGD